MTANGKRRNSTLSKPNPTALSSSKKTNEWEAKVKPNKLRTQLSTSPKQAISENFVQTDSTGVNLSNLRPHSKPSRLLLSCDSVIPPPRIYHTETIYIFKLDLFL